MQLLSMERGAPTAELGQTSVTAERTRSRTALSWCSAEGAGATTGTSTFLRARRGLKPSNGICVGDSQHIDTRSHPGCLPDLRIKPGPR